jgi:Ca2+-binding EF-hand superfamily protein
MLLPCEDNLLRNITLDRPACRVGRFDVLPHDIEHALLDVIEKEIDLQRRLEVLKHELECRYDYSPLAAFRSIDKYNDGRMTTHNLGSFLRSCGHYATERELLQIVRRMDTDGDAHLTYAEFADFIRSSCPPAVHHHHVVEPRCSSPMRSSYNSPLKKTAEPARCSSPVRIPVHCSPVRTVHCSPVRTVQCSPARCTPVRHCSHARVSPCKKPILHLHEEDQLVNGLRDTVAQERELEATKVNLTLKPDFNLHDAFAIFDTNHDGQISTAEVREGLAAIGVFPTHDEVDLFFKRYDSDNSGEIGFKEFAKAFESDDTYYAHMLNRRPSNHRHACYRRDDCFYADTQIEFRNMWRVHFKCENGAEQVRQRLQR